MSDNVTTCCGYELKMLHCPHCGRINDFAVKGLWGLRNHVQKTLRSFKLRHRRYTMNGMTRSAENTQRSMTKWTSWESELDRLMSEQSQIAFNIKEHSSEHSSEHKFSGACVCDECDAVFTIYYSPADVSEEKVDFCPFCGNLVASIFQDPHQNQK